MNISDNILKCITPNILYFSYYTLGATNTSPYHSHTYYEFTYVYECKGTYRVDDKEIKVKNGDIILFPPGCKHEEIIPSSQQFNIFVAGIDGVNFNDISGFYDNFGSVTPFIDTGEYHKNISSCCEEIRKEILKCDVGYRYMTKLLIEKILILLIRCKAPKNMAASDDKVPLCIDYSNKKDIISKIKYFIDFYYSSDISLEDIAHNVYLSPVYIIKIFKEETGETPISYLIKVRINKAKELLYKKNLTLSEIAEMVGYKDVVHFSKLFKKHTGYSPKKYLSSRILAK